MRIFCQILYGRPLFFRLLAALVFDVTKPPWWIIIRMRHLSRCIVLFIHGLPERVSVWVWHTLVGAGCPGWEGLLRVLAATKRRPWRIIAVYRSALSWMHVVNRLCLFGKGRTAWQIGGLKILSGFAFSFLSRVAHKAVSKGCTRSNAQEGTDNSSGAKAVVVGALTRGNRHRVRLVTVSSSLSHLGSGNSVGAVFGG